MILRPMPSCKVGLIESISPASLDCQQCAYKRIISMGAIRIQQLLISLATVAVLERPLQTPAGFELSDLI